MEGVTLVGTGAQQVQMLSMPPQYQSAQPAPQPPQYQSAPQQPPMGMAAATPDTSSAQYQQFLQWQQQQQFQQWQQQQQAQAATHSTSPSQAQLQQASPGSLLCRRCSNRRPVPTAAPSTRVRCSTTTIRPRR